jgi:carboxylesterase type B
MVVGIALLAVASALAAGPARPAAAAADPSAPPACTTPPVSTPSGRFCGLAVTVKDEAGTFAADAYEGIRYGNAKRWTAPTPAPAAAGLVRATAFGPICPQAPGDGTNQSEDCLYLNLWTPTRSSVKNLPVMVFIHGGFFVSGAGSLPVYDGARLAVRGAVIVVTLNYRLGALGFLAGGSGADRLAGNYGFQDQQRALQWVRRNIRSFGGDPAKITIFGESAGAMSVGAHLVAPGSQTLFRSAIMESNPYGIPFKTPPQVAQIRSEFDKTPDAAACRGHLACLARLPTATIVKAQGKVVPIQQLFAGHLGTIVVWAPYVDGGLIAGQPNQSAIVRPLIAGTNRDEGTLFVDAAIPKGLSNLEYVGLITEVFGLKALQILGDPRYQPDGKGNLVPLANLVGDYFFSCATRHVLGHATGARFGYTFDHPPSYAVSPTAPPACQPGAGPNRGRVCHAFELPFVFRSPVTFTLPPVLQRFTPAEQHLVDAISAYWTGFAAAGDPNAGAGAPPDWPAYGAPGTRQVLDLTISQTKDAALNCPLWDRIGYEEGTAAIFNRLDRPAGPPLSPPAASARFRRG